MSVIIKGMEMPEPGEHLLSLQVYHDGTAIVIGNHRYYEKEPFEAIPVPPHGRLIDADALMKQVEHDTPLSAVFEKTMRWYLNNAPTIIPAEGGGDTNGT